MARILIWLLAPVEWWHNRVSRQWLDYVQDMELHIANLELATEFIRHERLDLRFGAYVANRRAQTERWPQLAASEARAATSALELRELMNA